MAKKRRPPAPAKFGVGHRVRVKHDIRDTDYPDMPLGGWAAILCEARHERRVVTLPLRELEVKKGKPITLYRWDLECLLDVITVALEDDYPDKATPEYQALKRLGESLHKEYDDTYGHG